MNTYFRPTSIKDGSNSSTIEGYIETSTSKTAIKGIYETKVLTNGTTVCVLYCKSDLSKDLVKLKIAYTKGEKRYRSISNMLM